MAFRSRIRQLQWSSAGEDFGVAALKLEGVNKESLSVESVPGSLLQMVREFVPPVLDDPAHPSHSPHRQAIFLLKIASEVEHAFLLQYLYAAYSLNGLAGQPIANAIGKFVDVAKQEMAHLITVQNLLLALGHPLDLNREDFPAHPHLYPFPAALEPVSLDTIAKYVTAEAPPPNEIVDIVERKLAEAAAEQTALTIPHVHRVGAIYAALYWLFQSGDRAEGPWKLPQDVIDVFVKKYGAGFHLKDGDFIDAAAIANFIAIPDEWHVSDDSMHVDPGSPRASALKALYTISAQGEGPTADTNVPSHFQVFLAMYRCTQFPPAAVRDIPANPQVVPPQSPGAGLPNAITNEETANWARLLNARYRTLLLDILIGMSLDRTAEGQLRQQILGDWAVGTEMVAFISVIAPALTGKLRGSATDTPKFAGAPFEFGDQLPDSPCGRWKEQSSLIQTCAALIATLSKSPGLTTEERQLLDGMSAFDKGRQPVIDGKIKQLCA